jgi:carbon storage regulator CsrA
MLVLTRKNRESVVIGRPDEMQVVLEITILEIEGGRVRLGFQADTRMPIHRREVWDRICNGEAPPADADGRPGSARGNGAAREAGTFGGTAPLGRSLAGNASRTTKAEDARAQEPGI